MSGEPLSPIELDDAGSFAWTADPGEWMQRTSAAIVLPEGVLVVDPLDAPGLDEALAARGTVLGVATLLDRHRRDAEAIAARLRVGRLLPRALGGPGVRIDGVEERRVIVRRGWHEAALWLPDRRLLVCAETLGTSPFFVVRDGDPLGMHPLARLLRARAAFAGLEPRRIAVGHGTPVLQGATEAMAAAVAHPLRDLPRAWARSAWLLARQRYGSRR